MKIEKRPKYIRIGDVEFYFTKFAWYDKIECAGGCRLYSFLWFGFTILGKDCA